MLTGEVNKRGQDAELKNHLEAALEQSKQEYQAENSAQWAPVVSELERIRTVVTAAEEELTAIRFVTVYNPVVI